MKITIEHYNTMKEAIKVIPFVTFDSHVAILRENTKIKDFQRALRWQCIKLAGLTPFVCDTLYSYLNDDHIDTALRSIMKELNLNDIERN